MIGVRPDVAWTSLAILSLLLITYGDASLKSCTCVVEPDGRLSVRSEVHKPKQGTARPRADLRDRAPAKSGSSLKLSCGKSTQRCDPLAIQLAENSYFSSLEVVRPVVEGVLKVYPEGTWLQIGANTLDPSGDALGINDPLLQFLPAATGYRKLFVEPIPELFAALERNLAQMGLRNVTAINAAILDTEGPEQQVDMYCAPEQLFVGNKVGGCSFSREKVLQELGGVPPRRLQVPAMSVTGLFQKYQISGVKIVLVDAEGFDDKIVMQLPFDSPSFRPALVVFEHLFLEGDRFEKLKDFLHSHCYILVRDITSGDLNTYAVAI